MIQKLKRLLLSTSVLALFSLFFVPVTAGAATTLKASDCPSGKISTQDPSKCAILPKQCSNGKVSTKDDSVCAKLDSDCPSGHADKNDDTKCVPLGNDCPVGTTSQACLQKNPIVQDLNIIVSFLSGLVGVVVVGVIILGGIQYATAGDKAEAVSAAKKRIINGLIALVAFLFIFAFLQWLIPGGIFS